MILEFCEPIGELNYFQKVVIIGTIPEVNVLRLNHFENSSLLQVLKYDLYPKNLLQLCLLVTQKPRKLLKFSSCILHCMIHA